MSAIEKSGERGESRRKASLKSRSSARAGGGCSGPLRPSSLAPLRPTRLLPPSPMGHVDTRLCSFTRSPACISTDERACARLYHMPRHRQRCLGSYRLLRAQHVESTPTGFGPRQKDHGGRRYMYAGCYPRHLPLTDGRRLSRRKLGAVDSLSRRRVYEHRTADTSCLTDVSSPLCVPWCCFTPCGAMTTSDFPLNSDTVHCLRVRHTTSFSRRIEHLTKEL
jgi:hypothetical protein